MKRATSLKIALVLAVPLCLALVTFGYALWSDPVTQLQIAKYVRNAWSGVSLPKWQILQDGTAKSIQWIDWEPNPRFAIYDLGTPGDLTDDLVCDKETQLVWTRNTDTAGGTTTWYEAMQFSHRFSLANRYGFRIPDLKEMYTLITPGAIVPGHPFINIPEGKWWTTTPDETDINNVYGKGAAFDFCTACRTNKEDACYTWLVRGGYTSGANIQPKGPDPLALIVDNPNATYVGTWPSDIKDPGYYRTDYQYSEAGAGGEATWTPDIANAGNYKVCAWWVGGNDRATNAPYTIYYDGGSETVNVNQQVNGGRWNLVGSYPFAAGISGHVVLTDNADGKVTADAIKWEPYP